MNNYLVLSSFEGHKKGDIIQKNARQAKYLVMNGLLKLKPQSQPQAKQDTKKGNK